MRPAWAIGVAALIGLFLVAAFAIRSWWVRPGAADATALPDVSFEEALRAGNARFDEGRAWDAEQHYRQALRQRPHDSFVNRRLMFLLTAEGRRWESRSHLLELVRQQDHTLEELILLGDIWPDYDLTAELQRFRQAVPRDPLPLLGLARLAVHRQEIDEALAQLRDVVRGYPQLAEAHAWLGWSLVQSAAGTGTLSAIMADWEEALPVGAADHPLIWLVRGLAAEQSGQPSAALRCHWEAVLRDPNFELAVYRLSRVLHAAGKQAESETFRKRTELLYQLAATLKRIHSDRNNLARLSGGVATLREVATNLESLGRWWEAWAWYGVIVAQDTNSSWARDAHERLGRQLRGDTPLVAAESNPARQLDFSSYPLPRWPTARAAIAAPSESRSTGGAQFADMAEETGIRFAQYNGDPPGNPRFLGTTGGGVGVLDYDGDGWPDLYFTQACPWPLVAGQTEYRDRLFRNLGTGRFADVTEQAGLGDEGFSQGVAVGDFDNDGWPDIYLANVGANRLYRNQGDGAFEDVTDSAGIQNTDWTTSCVLADLNGDAWPDLYDVNYVGGDALTRRCVIKGRPRPCPPSLFPAQDDRLYLSLGDGRFADTTRQSGIVGERGKGLGVVAADFDGSRRLSLFVANDGTPNFFYRHESPPGEREPRYVEIGMLSGLALDRLGNFQACMGVAADDANGDGWLDLFVTNFFQESNTLYVAEDPGQLYEDRTAEFGLREGSLRMLGFGAQFLDGDLDGWPDLIMTNGHVQDFSDLGLPYRMPAQYYRNLQGRRFQELTAETLGPFFREARLGRGLARLDWNRDGREDVVISHVGTNAALLTNRTDPVGHFLALQLRGVVSARDAIGTVVEAVVGGRTMVRQLTAGDGYQASNQRQLIFGLGDANRVEQLTIRWPSGITQTFSGSELGIDSQYLAIEGREEFFLLAARGEGE